MGSLQPPHLGGAIQKYGALLGAVGVSGDTSDSDEVCAMSYRDRGGKYQGQRGVTLPKT